MHSDCLLAIVVVEFFYSLLEDVLFRLEKEWLRTGQPRRGPLSPTHYWQTTGIIVKSFHRGDIPRGDCAEKVTGGEGLLAPVEKAIRADVGQCIDFLSRPTATQKTLVTDVLEF
jgi:hypothetical protein